ncbi:hypothetical protein [Streptomyces genisteinicus]|uniref:Uncharacterized protein n=1 Tax=Streptomyces genisteinicus TaxID=2768068 RepID=A0A7H0HSA4_9ACTN|nr:hypothetical protein [Streptomyces genisteinicus]QNP63420.1 hypothetical protein IAG43_11070 [Streptomyces genisteinicus]
MGVEEVRAEEEPPGGGTTPGAARGPARWARAPRGERMLWIAAGAVLVLGTVAMLLGIRHWAAGFDTGVRYGVGIALRGAMFLMLLGGTYCVVRGSRRDQGGPER